jgi:exodeoxyribonuclease VII small subunit
MPPNPKLTFASAYKELQDLLAAAEGTQDDLEKSIAQYKRATELSKFLKKELQKMESQIEEINLDAATSEPPAQAEIPEPDDQTDIPF